MGSMMQDSTAEETDRSQSQVKAGLEAEKTHLQVSFTNTPLHVHATVNDAIIIQRFLPFGTILFVGLQPQQPSILPCLY